MDTDSFDSLRVRNWISKWPLSQFHSSNDGEPWNNRALEGEGIIMTVSLFTKLPWICNRSRFMIHSLSLSLFFLSFYLLKNPRLLSTMSNGSIYMPRWIFSSTIQTLRLDFDIPETLPTSFPHVDVINKRGTCSHRHSQHFVRNLLLKSGNKIQNWSISMFYWQSVLEPETGYRQGILVVQEMGNYLNMAPLSIDVIIILVVVVWSFVVHQKNNSTETNKNFS